MTDDLAEYESDYYSKALGAADVGGNSHQRDDDGDLSSSTMDLFLSTRAQNLLASTLAAAAQSPPRWEDVEVYPYLSTMLDNNPDSLQLFRSVYAAGVRDPSVLKSLAFLSSKEQVGTVDETMMKSAECSNIAAFSSPAYSGAVHTLACYLADPELDPTARTACIRLLMTLRSPVTAGWQLNESVITDTVHFVTERAFTWEYPQHSDEVLLYELRAICCCEKDRYSQQQEQRQRIREGAETAASYIGSSARWVESGLSQSTRLLEGGIEMVGESLKGNLEPAAEPLIIDERSRVVTLTYTEAARRATDTTRSSAQRAVDGLCQASTKGIHAVAEKITEQQVAEKLVPDENNRTVLAAAGQVGVASLGAAAIVGEAIFESTKTVAQKAASVTADVVHHKYGHSAGQVVRDASDTAGNILRIVASAAMLEGKVFTKVVAKNTGKAHLESRLDKEEESFDDPKHAKMEEDGQGKHDLANETDDTEWETLPVGGVAMDCSSRSILDEASTRRFGKSMLADRGRNCDESETDDTASETEIGEYCNMDTTTSKLRPLELVASRPEEQPSLTVQGQLHLRASNSESPETISLTV